MDHDQQLLAGQSKCNPPLLFGRAVPIIVAAVRMGVPEDEACLRKCDAVFADVLRRFGGIPLENVLRHRTQMKPRSASRTQPQPTVHLNLLATSEAGGRALREARAAEPDLDSGRPYASQ
jgi:hypothetical protein